MSHWVKGLIHSWADFSFSVFLKIKYINNIIFKPLKAHYIFFQ